MYQKVSIESTLNRLNEIITASPRDASIDEVLGNLTIMPEHLWISSSGRWSLFVASSWHGPNYSWGNETLMVDTEMAAARPVQEQWLPEYTNLQTIQSSILL